MTEGDKIERLRDRMLQCPICMDEYKDPRILPCHHSICMSCILEYINNSTSTRGAFRCPQCRATVTVPLGGVHDFPPNFYINCIQDEIGSKPYFGICDLCQKDWLVSQYRCVECDKDICKFCVHRHRLVDHKAGRQVNIMRIETGNIGVSLTSQPNCSTHDKEPLLMYCNKCELPICVKCACADHKSHDTTSLTDKLQLAKKCLQFDLDNIQIQARQVKQTMQKVGESETCGEKSAEDAITRVQARAREIKEMVQNLADEKTEEIQSKKGCHIAAIRSYETDLTAYYDNLQRGILFLNDLQTEDMSLELVECFRDYQGDIEYMHKSLVNRKIKHDLFNFMPGRVIQHNSMMAVNIGSLKTEEVTQTLMVEEVKTSFCRKALRHVSRVAMLSWLILIYLCMMVGIYQLATCRLTDKDSHPSQSDFSVGRVVCLPCLVYVCIAGIFAFKKSCKT